MSLHSFLAFNRNCPICNNELGLYWQWTKKSDSPLFKAIEVEPSTYYFAKYNPAQRDYSDKDDRSMTLFDYGNKFNTSFSCPSLLTDAKTHNMYFYYLCSERGFDSKGLHHYELNLAQGCYYRSSPLMEFQKEDNEWKLRHVVEEFSGLPYKDECFCLKKRREREDKFYMLNRDLETETTKIFHHTITDEQRKDPKFRPTIFRKELPLVPRPSFEDKGKLISRMETWIIMS